MIIPLLFEILPPTIGNYFPLLLFIELLPTKTDDFSDGFLEGSGTINGMNVDSPSWNLPPATKNDYPLLTFLSGSINSTGVFSSLVAIRDSSYTLLPTFSSTHGSQIQFGSCTVPAPGCLLPFTLVPNRSACGLTESFVIHGPVNDVTGNISIQATPCSFLHFIVIYFSSHSQCYSGTSSNRRRRHLFGGKQLWASWRIGWR
jgi:hypothetical protein